MRDNLEAFTNAALGLVASILAVYALRALGLWDTLPAEAIAAVFFGVSFTRARVLRWVFRRTE